MDGQTLESDPRTAEYLRQKEIYARCMAGLERETRKKEALGYAVMAAVYSFEPESQNKGLLAKSVTFSKLALIAALGILPNLALIMMLTD